MIELLTPTEMAEADRLTIAAGTPGRVLMERAGRAVAEVVERRRAGRPVLVVCGRGNNGGDGFVVARLLRQRGAEVRVVMLGRRQDLRGDAASAAEAWTGPIGAVTPDVVRPGEVVVDALFGAGLDRDLEGDARALVESLNASGAEIVAVDLPSGIDGATGAIRGAAIEATESVTFFRRKPGHLLLPGRAHGGLVHVADIGIDAAVLGPIAPAASVNSPLLWRAALPKLAVAGHKYSRGHAVVASGPVDATGAARLAARAALRIGAGLVTVASPAAALLVNAAALEAIMVRRADGAAGLGRLLADERLNAVVLGPGLPPDETTRQMVALVAGLGRALVLDAGAVTAFAGDVGGLAGAFAARAAERVLTPHAGEFARLFGDGVSAAGKLERTRAAARDTGAVVLFKGPDTVIAAPDGRAAITENAPPTLGTAGSGDVLSGMIGGLLAQGMPAFEAACAAAWLHGEAANAFGRGLIAEDLPEELPRLLQRLDPELRANAR